MDCSEIIFVQTPEHKKTLLERFPDANEKVFTIKEYSLPRGKKLGNELKPREIRTTGENEMKEVWKLTDEIRRISRRVIEQVK
ncbi:MAG: hypothetical protein QW112_02150 [Candidatus Micrarchaeia archaeon]